MSKAKSKLDEKDKVIRVLVIVLVVLGCIVINAHTRVMEMPKDFTFHTPPDLSVGGQAKIGEVPETTAFNFAFMIMGGINTWVKDGSKEFKTNVDGYRNYLSGDFYRLLRSFAEKETANNRQRRRDFIWEANATSELASLGGFSVDDKGNNRFHVTFAARLIDEINGYEIRNEVMMYHFIVEQTYIPRQLNPWQLRVVGQFKESERVD